ncbi:MAG: hypothetical protein WKF99_02560, partial [Solirubrobacteraceae bacterium]
MRVPGVPASPARTRSASKLATGAATLGRHDQPGELLSARFLGRPAEQGLRLRVPGQDRAALVDRDEGVVGGVQDMRRLELVARQPALEHADEPAGHPHRSNSRHPMGDGGERG